MARRIRPTPIGHSTDAIQAGRMPSSVPMQAGCQDDTGAIQPTAHRGTNLARPFKAMRST
jgi:hypothetical protein